MDKLCPKTLLFISLGNFLKHVDVILHSVFRTKSWRGVKKIYSLSDKDKQSCTK